MSKEHKYLKAKAPLIPANQKKTILILSAAIVAVLLLILLLLLSLGKSDPAPTEPTVITEAPTEATTEATTEPAEETEPPVTEPQMLPNMKELYEQNPDTVGWIRIDGTKLDYPVMWTPNEKWKYDHLSFEGEYDYGGTPYIKEACSIDPPSTNLIIYGHNMANGSQFRTIVKYQEKKFWQENPTIYYSTLYEEQEYEILAVFLDRIYKKTDTCFKYYDFIDPQTEEEFNEGIQYFKEKSLYDTGVTAEFGDHLITLVTCAYHVENGRFVVVARQVVDEPAEKAIPET